MRGSGDASPEQYNNVWNRRYIFGISMSGFEWSTVGFSFYKLRCHQFLISHKLKTSQMSQIKSNQYVANVSISNATSERNFKLSEYTSLADIQDEIHHLLPQGDNRKNLKLEYHSLSIHIRRKIEFNNFELKTDADVRAMWNTFFSFQNKSSAQVVSGNSKIDQRYSENVEAFTLILKCNVAFYVKIIYVMLILYYEC